MMIAAYEKLLSHKTAIQITTNEPQSCVFCEGGKTFLYKIHPVAFNGFKSLRKGWKNVGVLICQNAYIFNGGDGGID